MARRRTTASPASAASIILLLAAVSSFIFLLLGNSCCDAFAIRTSSTATAAGRRTTTSSSTTITRLSSSTSSAPVAAVNGEQDTSEANGSSSAKLEKEIRLNVNEKARTVASVCTSGTLCTVSSHEGIEGAPFGSFVDYVLDDEGNPVFLMNEMSMHTINIQKASENKDGNNPGATMVTLFTQLGSSSSPNDSRLSGPLAMSQGGGGKSKGLQDVSRCSITGTLTKIEPDTAQDWDTIRMRYSLTHAYADQVMDSPKFAFYRLEPSKIYFVGGFGVLAKWVDPTEYKLAAPDILAKEASDILLRMNCDHGDDLILTAKHLLDYNYKNTEIEKIRVTNVDRLGMDIRVTSQMGSRRNKLSTDEFRIGFRIPVISVEDAKSEILKIFQEAWEKANDITWGSGEDDLAHDNVQPGADVPIMKIAADSLE